MVWQFSLSMGLVFSSIAAGMAFLITYEEYSYHHQFPPGQALKQSVHAAAVTLVFFVLLALVVGMLLSMALSGAQP